MECIVTNVDLRDNDETGIGYIVIKAEGRTGDAEASALDENGFINPLACMSRVYQFTKTLFPSTPEQYEALGKAVVEGAKIRLDLIREASPTPFNIVRDLNADTVEDRYYTEDTTEQRVNNERKPITVNGKVVKPNETYEAIVKKPKVFREITLTVFTRIVDGHEVCAEGEPAQLLTDAWNRGVSRGIYEPVTE